MDAMNPYASNFRWLAMFAPFRALSLSAAYLTPFFLDKGLDLASIFLLQSIFSIVAALWEMPSGMLADKLGRANSIRISALLAGSAMTAYGFSDHYWQFVVCEILLAIAVGMFSGADKALLYDSLRADKSLSEAQINQRFQALIRRIKSAAFVVVFFAAPISALLVHYFSISAVIIADGLLLLFGSSFAWKLKEAPYRHEDLVHEAEEELLSTWQAIKKLLGQVELRWLLFLGTILSTSTYLAAWSSAPYYESIGIPLAAFGAMYAIRSLIKAVVAYRYSEDSGVSSLSGIRAWRQKVLRRKFLPRQPEFRLMWMYAAMAGLGYVVMATGWWWLLPLIVVHDIVHALHDDPIVARLNASMDARNRAALNSVSQLFHRLAYAIGGPIAGLLVSRAGLQSGFLLLGLACSLLASIALLRLRHFGTFKPT